MPVDRSVKIASRGSRLALAQSGEVRRQLGQAWPGREFEVVTVETRGDREIDRPIPEIGGKGLFTEALETELLAGRVDLAIHSLKDLPTEMPQGLILGAVAGRADARDVWVAGPDGPAGPDVAAAGSRIGTSSERRRAQLLALRPDLEPAPVRGNVETRIRKLDEGQYDALILAAAGLIRLGLSDRITSYLESPGWLPAPGQGALAVQCRSGDPEIEELLDAIDVPSARTEIAAERALLAALEGGCQVPLGAHAEVRSDGVVLYALLARPDGSEVITGEAWGRPEDAAEIGRRLARDLLARDGGAILAAARGSGS